MSMPSLPPEILARIFSEAACHCRGTTVYDFLPPVLNLVTISAVCKRWRVAALDYRSLWAHLDLEVYSLDTDRGYYSPKVWIERLQGAPLYIHIRQYRQFGDSGAPKRGTPAPRRDDRPLGSMIARLNEFLQSLMSQVCSLTLIICWPKDSAVEKLLAGSATRGISGRAKVLKVESDPNSREPDIAPRIYFNSSLDSLEVLHIDLAALSWSNLTPSNLIDLRLDVVSFKTQSELASVLASCPGLRWLALTGIISDHTQPAPSPVLLNELQVLDIGSRCTATLASILAIITPGNSPLRLKISFLLGFKSPDETLAEMPPFLNRANVTVCELGGWGMPSFVSQLYSLPRVQTLILRGWSFSDWVWYCGYHIRPETYGRPPPIGPVHWPHLQKLYLDGCTLEKQYLYRLLSRHSISALYMQNCHCHTEVDLDYRMSLQTCEEYARLFSEVVPVVTHVTGRRSPWPLLSS